MEDGARSKARMVDVIQQVAALIRAGTRRSVVSTLKVVY